MNRMYVGLLTAVALFTPPVSATEIVVPVSADAAILADDGSPGTAANNFGIFNYLYAGSYDPDNGSYSRSLMKFVLPPVPAGQSLQSASLHLVIGQEFPQTKVFDFFRVDDNWDEGSVTWLSAPQLVPTQQPIATFDSAIGLGPAPPPRNALSFDITSAVEDEQSSDPTHTLSILWKERNEAGTCCNRLIAHSKELAVIPSNVSQVILTFVPEPSTAGLLAGLVVLLRVRVMRVRQCRQACRAAD